MGTQRYVSTSFYDDRWVQSLDPTEKFIYLYLLTNPLTNIAGVYKIEDRRISFDTGFTTEVVSFVLGKFEKAGKAYRMDEYIVIPSWPKHQKWEKAPKIKQGIILNLMELEEEYLRKLVTMNYRFDLRIVFDRLSIPYERVFSTDTNSKYPSNYSDPDSDLDPNIDSDPDINSGKAGMGGSSEPPDKKSVSKKQKPDKPKKPPLREREPENDMELVEKTYLQNWDELYSQKRVETADPVINWGQTRKLLKTHFATLKPEQIIQAINNGLKDDFVLKGGYSLAMMLSASVLNRLINTSQGAPPPGLADRKSLAGLKSIF